MAQYAENYGLQQPPPPPAEEGELLVTTADGKGVPMRRPPELSVHHGPHRAQDEKTNKKQMAYVGAVYTIDRFHRTPDDVLDEVLRKQHVIGRIKYSHFGAKLGSRCDDRWNLYDWQAV